MKNKNAAIFLMVASIFWTLSEIYWMVVRFTGSAWEYYRDKPLEVCINALMVIVPVSLLVFSISLINNKTEPASNDTEEISAADNQQNLTVGNWLLNFLIALIPLVGLIFTIIWANDNKNKIRKNWAIASLIWTGIMLVLFMVLYRLTLTALVRGF